MALTLRHRKLYRTIFAISRNYCEEKSIYQKNEEGPKPRTVYGQEYPDWRKPWIKRDGEWKTKLSVFIEKNPNPNVLLALSQVPTITIEQIKEWWGDLKDLQEIENQKYLPNRVAILGPNLAALHFFTFRHGAVRLRGSNDWIAGDATTLNLPQQYEDGYFVEAIDCSKFHHNGVRYEGLQNLTGLNFLKWLSLRNNKFIDVWCLDRLAGQNGKSLEYLDIRGCNLCVGGVIALARMQMLKFLLITDPGEDMELQAALSLLEEENPNLLIKAEPKEEIEDSSK